MWTLFQFHKPITGTNTSSSLYTAFLLCASDTVAMIYDILWVPVPLDFQKSVVVVPKIPAEVIQDIAGNGDWFKRRHLFWKGLSLASLVPHVGELLIWWTSLLAMSAAAFNLALTMCMAFEQERALSLNWIYIFVTASLLYDHWGALSSYKNQHYLSLASYSQAISNMYLFDSLVAFL